MDGFSAPKRMALVWWFCFLLSVVILLTVEAGKWETSASAHVDVHEGDDISSHESWHEIQNDNQHPSAGTSQAANNPNESTLMLISTMDGQMTALNAQDGKMQWAIDTGALLSSSISKIEINRQGIPTHLIPSLDGGLYQFDGETLEPVPLAADILLSSSFRFNGDSMVVGGKETESFGLDLKTGKIRYICAMDGCRYSDEEKRDPKTALFPEEDDETLIISRHTKTIRAIEMRTGAEKWNFSVGQHEVTYANHASSREDVMRSITHERYDEEEEDVEGEEEEQCAAPPAKGDYGDPDDLSDCEYCHVRVEEDDEDTEEELHEPHSRKQLSSTEFKVVVPRGIVFAVNKDDPSVVLWEHKFNAAVADAWILSGQSLSKLSLFDSHTNLALGVTDESEGQDQEGFQLPSSPVIYVGMHEKQLYVQPSIQMQREVELASAQLLRDGESAIKMPRVRWLPYLATASSRTPAVAAKQNPHLIGWRRDYEDEAEEETTEEERRLTLWQDHYPYDNGYYLFSSKSPVHLPEITNKNENTTETFEETDITVSLMNWWREVLAISIIMSVMVHLFLVKFFPSRSPTPADSGSGSQSSGDSVESLAKTNSDSSMVTVEGQTAPGFHYVSRYQTDFEQVACLGKGGFGVVFQAKNKLDDCDYAIKRIALNNSDRAKQKVMREVKALAKLDHVGIVRYNQAWFECPPPGWQEEQDLLNTDLHSSGITPGMTLPSDTISVQPSEKMASKQDVNPLKPFGGISSGMETQNNLWDITENKEEDQLGSSEGFEPSDPQKEPPSLGLGDFNPNKDDSFEICFEESSVDESPFKRYNSTVDDSVDIIFEGGTSGAGDSLSWDDMAHASSKSPEETHEQSADSSQPPPCRPKHLNLEQRRPVSSSSRHHSSPGGPSLRLYLYIQMQMCQRESLKDWLNGNTLSRDRSQCLDFFHQILCAVDYVHQHGLMHRDLKPSNIFFSMDGAVKVGDFGLVTALEETCELTPDEKSGTKSKSLRHTDQVGTELYMSPEQCARQSYTQKVDIYALGMIFFELFYPFSTQMERIKTLMEIKKLNFPHRFEKELPKEYKFMLPMLSHDSAQRPSSSELLQSTYLVNFEENHLHRTRSASRSRTISNSSSGSSP